MDREVVVKLRTEILIALALIALGAGLVVGVSKAAAGTVTIIGPPSSGLPYQRWADEARVPLPDGVVTVVEMSTEDAAWPCFTLYGYEPNGCVLLQKREIYLDPMRLSMQGQRWLNVRSVLWHELGHLFDVLYLTPEDRAYFAAFVHVPAAPWLSDQTHDTVGEWFAEVYAICAHYGGRYPTQGVFEALIIPPEELIGPKRFRRLCRFVRFAYWR